MVFTKEENVFYFKRRKRQLPGIYSFDEIVVHSNIKRYWIMGIEHVPMKEERGAQP